MLRRGLLRFVFKGVPGTFWLIGIYTIINLVAYFGGNEPVDVINNDILFTLPLVKTSVPMMVGDTFVVLVLLSMALEAWRATRIHDRSGNDLMSLLAFAMAGVLLIVVPWYGTATFSFVVVAGAVDLMLDRVIGQAVARRDFGIGGAAGLYGHEHHSG